MGTDCPWVVFLPFDDSLVCGILQFLQLHGWNQWNVCGDSRHEFLLFALFAWELKMPALVVLAVILAGSCLGFLPYNFPQARTFMGDNGSLPSVSSWPFS